jgi:hypothetical protein
MEIEYPERLINYLTNFGRAKFYPVIFHKRGIDYATIELETASELAEGLEREINSELTEQNGIRAYMRFIAHSDLGLDRKGRNWHRYMAEVVPYELGINEEELLEISKEYLHQLPKVIRNYRKKRKVKLDK